MAITVGIPRALTYHKYHALWLTFFGEMGVEVVVSAPSSRSTVNRGVAISENELCVPVKLAFGHAAALAGECDYVFLPRIVAIERHAYTCPKFFGLPDMIRAAELDIRILSPTVNLRTGRRGFKKTVIELGRTLGASAPRTRRAFRSGMRELERYEEQLRLGLTPVDIEDGVTSPDQLPPVAGDGVTIGIVGHPYNLYDRHVSMNLVRRLRHAGVRIVSPEMLPPSAMEHQAASLPKELFWTYEKEVVGAALHWAREGGVDGIIYVLSFACGPDSLVQVLVEDEVRRESGVPLMSLVVDEHSAEAGLVTRLEAFLDMLRWRHGQVA